MILVISLVSSLYIPLNNINKDTLAKVKEYALYNTYSLIPGRDFGNPIIL